MAKVKKASVNIKKGDTVKVIAGRDKGAEGKIIKVLREEQRVIVEGVNRVKRHTKVVNQGGRAGTTGGIITTEAPIHVSNVMLVEGDGVTRIGFRRDEVTQASSRRLDLRRDAQRPHLPQDRQGNLMSETETETDSRTEEKVTPSTQDALPRGDPPGAAVRVRHQERHAGARPDQDRGQHGRRRGGSRLQADRGRRPRPHRDHRPEAGRDQGPAVDRAVQAARGHADRHVT